MSRSAEPASVPDAAPPVRRRSVPWRWLAVGAALFLFAAAGLSRISFDVDILKLLPTHLRQVEGLSLFLKHFSQPNELIVTLEAPTPEEAEAGAEAIAAELGALPHLVKRAVARPPWEKNPAELAELLAYLVVNQPPERGRALAARLNDPGQAAETLRGTLEKLTESVSPQEIALRGYDPYDLLGSLDAAGWMSSGGGARQQSEFASADGTFRVVYVEAARPFANYNETIAWVKEIRRATAAWRDRPGWHVAFTGEPAFVATVSASMEWDMMSSGFVTLVVIALLFWLCYGRARPLLDLQAMLVLTFTLSLAAAGLFLDRLTVIGVGCAAIMMGLSVDYGYFIYHRSRQHGGTVRELQRHCVQYIAWTAGTTAAAFFALQVSSLPGLSQLGTLVGLGVSIGAVIMLTVFAPLTRRFHARAGDGADRPPAPVERLVASAGFHRVGFWVTLALVAGLLGTLAVKGLPGMDFSARTLRPRHSEAYSAMERLYARLTDDRGFLSLVVRGGSPEEVLGRLRAVDEKLLAAQARGDVKSFRSPLPLWPDAARQRANLAALTPLAAEIPRLRQTLGAAGFQDEAFALTEAAIRQWETWATQPAATPIWPGNLTSRWILRRLASQPTDANGQWLALGLVQPADDGPRAAALAEGIQDEGVYIVGWSVLGAELVRVIPREFAKVTLGLVVAVLAILALAFRSARAVGLFVATTALVLTCLAGLMSLLGMTWNFFNLASLLLLLGTGTDYSILMLLALRRNNGDVPAARRELALVICLCATSAAAGFGTISWANHAGLASLGQTCALGLLLDAAVSIFLLPWAWQLLVPQRKVAGTRADFAAAERRPAE